VVRIVVLLSSLNELTIYRDAARRNVSERVI